MTSMPIISTWMSSILPMIECHFHTKNIVFQTWMHFIYPHSPISIYMHYTCTLWECTPQRQTSMSGDGGETKECTLDVLNIDRGLPMGNALMNNSKIHNQLIMLEFVWMITILGSILLCMMHCHMSITSQ
jgi:hypothetical protein